MRWKPNFFIVFVQNVIVANVFGQTAMIDVSLQGNENTLFEKLIEKLVS